MLTFWVAGTRYVGTFTCLLARCNSLAAERKSSVLPPVTATARTLTKVVRTRKVCWVHHTSNHQIVHLDQDQSTAMGLSEALQWVCGWLPHLAGDQHKCPHYNHMRQLEAHDAAFIAAADVQAYLCSCQCRRGQFSRRCTHEPSCGCQASGEQQQEAPACSHPTCNITQQPSVPISSCPIDTNG